MTYAVFIRKSTGGAGEHHVLSLDPLAAVALSTLEENTHSYIMRYFKKDWRILDAGCGLGRWVLYLDSLGYKISGLDLSQVSIDRLKEIKPNIDARVGDISNMPYDDLQFDAVLSVGVVEHDAEGPEKMLREMNRVVKDGGMMIVVVPYESAFRRIFHRPACGLKRVLARIKGTKLEFEEYRYSKDDFYERVSNCGWEIIESSWVELTPKNRSYSLWVDWGNLYRDKKTNEPFALNSFGIFVKGILWNISRWINAEGIVIAARKKMRQ